LMGSRTAGARGARRARRARGEWLISPRPRTGTASAWREGLPRMTRAKPARWRRIWHIAKSLRARRRGPTTSPVAGRTV